MWGKSCMVLLVILLDLQVTNFILKTKKDFLVIFIIGGGFCMIKLFLTLIFDENDKYVYKEKISDLLEEHRNINKKVSEADIKQIIDDE